MSTTFEDRIRTLAAQGYSRSGAARELGISTKKLGFMLEYLPDIEWQRRIIPLPTEMAAKIESLCESGLTRPEAAEILQLSAMQMRGFCSRMPWLKWNRISRSRRDSYRNQGGNREKRTVMGFKGSITELIAHFQVSISDSTVRRRLGEGRSIEQALFDPVGKRPKIRHWYQPTILTAR